MYGGTTIHADNYYDTWDAGMDVVKPYSIDLEHVPVAHH